MKSKNKGIIILLEIVIVLCLLVLGISFQARMLLVDTISKEGIDRTVVNRLMDPLFQEGGMDSTEQLEEVWEFLDENEAIENITAKYLDEVSKSIAEGNDLTGVDITAELDQLIEGALLYADETIDSKSELEANTEVKEALKQKVRERLEKEKEEIKEVMEQYTQNIVLTQFQANSTDANPATMLVKLYVLLNGMLFRAVLITVIAALLFVVILLSGNKTKGFRNAAVPFLIAAFIFILLFQQIGIRLMMNLTNRYLGRTLMLDGTPFFVTGLIMAGIGFGFAVLALVLHVRKKNVKN